MSDVPPIPGEGKDPRGPAGGIPDDIGFEFLKALGSQFVGNLFKSKGKAAPSTAPEPGLYAGGLQILCTMIRSCPWTELAAGESGIVGFERLVMTFAAVAARAAVVLDSSIEEVLHPPAAGPKL